MTMSVDEIEELVDGDAAPGQVRSIVTSLLSRIVDGRLQVPALYHPLGFVYLPLRREAGYGVRIHIWEPYRPAAPLTMSPYHSHAWHLRSYVYCGRLTNILAEEVARPSEPEYRVFEIVGNGNTDILSPTSDLVSVRSTNAQRVEAGEAYEVAAGRFHSTVVDEDVCATTIAVVRSAPAFRERALGPLLLGPHRADRRPVPRELLIRAAAAAVRAAPAG